MGGSTADGAAWVIPGTAVAIAAIGGALELGGAAASALSGHGARFAPFTMVSAVAVARHGTTALWPSASPPIVAALAAVAAVATLGPVGLFGIRAWLRRPQPDSPSRSLARLADVRALTRVSVVRRAQQLRPCLADRKPKDIPLTEAGIHLGNLATAGNVALYGSWEDVALALMAPRAMKTTALSVPLVLDAPGPVIATANKSDLWAATSVLREASTGARVWAFDPQRIARVPQTWWWNPLRDIAEGESPVEEAERLAGHFVLTIEDSRSRDIWGPAARGLLAALLAIVSTVLIVPILVEFFETGLVPRMPTAVLSMGVMILASLSLTCGLVLDTVTRGRREMKRMRYLNIPAPLSARFE